MDFLYHFDLWHWLVVGAVLLIAEVVVSGGFLLWIGLSAVLVSFVVWLFPGLTWGTQMMLFGFLALTASIIWWAFLRKYPIHTDDPKLNRRSEQYVGREFELIEPIHNSRGKIKVDGTVWTVTGPELAQGIRVKIIRAQGVILVAEKSGNEQEQPHE